MPKRLLKVCRRGLTDYAEALNLQAETERAVIAREQPDTIFLLEHPHTFTIGRRADETGVLATKKLLETLGAKVFEINRGGKVTYHGIGQLVGYPILNLNPDRRDVHLYVRNLEEVLMRTLAAFDIESFRLKDLTGVHTKIGKVAAIGVHLKRWTTTHGFALNVSTDLDFFNHIISCEGEPVTTMQMLTGKDLTNAEVEDVIIEKFAEVFEYDELLK